MYGRGSLAATGAGVTMMGFDVSLSLIAAMAVLAVVLGGLSYRRANRKKRYAQ